MKNSGTMKLWLRILAMVMVMTMLVATLAACAPADTTSGGGKDDDGKTDVSEKNDDKPVVDTTGMEADEHWQYVSGEAIGGALDALTNTYGSLLGGVSGSSTQGGKVDLQLELGDVILEMIAQSMAQSGTDMDMDFLKNIHLAIEALSNGDVTKLDVLLGLNSTDIATISAIVDLANGKVLMAIPELSSTYLGIDLAEVGMDMSEMNQATAMVEQMMAAMPSEEVLQKLINKYLTIALESFTDIEKNTVTLESGDLEQECTALVVTIHHEDVLNLAKNVLTALKSDADVKKIIEDLADELGGGDGVYESFQEAIEYALADLEYDLEDPEDGEIVLTTYTDSSNAIIGMSLASPENDAEELHFWTVTEGNEFAFEMVMFDEFNIIGSGTIQNGKANGTYKLIIEGQTTVNMDVQNFDVNKLKNGHLSGTLVFTLPAMDGMMAGIIDGLKLTVSLDTGDKSSALGLRVDSKMGMLAALTVTVSNTTGGTLNVPNNYVDATSQEELMNWMMDIDLSKIISKLKKAGLPTELTSALEALEQQLESMK